MNGVLKFVIFVAVMATAIRVINPHGWEFGVETSTARLGVLNRQGDFSPIPCVLLTTSWGLCGGHNVRKSKMNVQTQDWNLRWGVDNYTLKNIRFWQSQNVTEIVVEEVRGYEENFGIALVRAKEKFKRTPTCKTTELLVLKHWPVEYKYNDAIFLGYSKHGDFAGAVKARRNLISSSACYARMSKWTIACMEHGARADLCFGETEEGKKISPEAIILVQDAFFGFFIETWDNFAWTCEDDPNNYHYGDSFPAMAPMQRWISSIICNQSIVLLPMDFPYVQNFTAGRRAMFREGFFGRSCVHHINACLMYTAFFLRFLFSIVRVI